MPCELSPSMSPAQLLPSAHDSAKPSWGCGDGQLTIDRRRLNELRSTTPQYWNFHSFMHPLLQFLNVSLSYGLWRRRVALKDVSFCINEGEHTLILGRAGAGKSTILRLISGAEAPTRGDVAWRGKRPTIGMAPQHVRKRGRRTVLDHLRAACSSIRDAAYLFNRCIAALQLEPILDAQLRSLTAQQLHRVSLAAALLSEAKVTLLDDPFSTLESLIRPLARSFITWSLADPTRHTLIAASPSLDDLHLPFTRALVMSDGRIVRDLQCHSLREYARGHVLLMPATVQPDAIRARLIDGGVDPDEAHAVRGLVDGRAMTIAGPFFPGTFRGGDVRPLTVELMLQIWERPAVHSVPVRRRTRSFPPPTEPQNTFRNV